MKNPMTREEMINSTSFNRATNTFTITKKLYNASCKYGTDEYNFVEELKNSQPNCKIIIRKSSKRDCYEGLGYVFMKNYIEKYDIENVENKNELDILIADKANYLEVKKWFFNKYPEVKEFGTKTISNKILDKKVCKSVA
jgi:hypothetical protein